MGHTVDAIIDTGATATFIPAQGIIMQQSQPDLIPTPTKLQTIGSIISQTVQQTKLLIKPKASNSQPIQTRAFVIDTGDKILGSDAVIGLPDLKALRTNINPCEETSSIQWNSSNKTQQSANFTHPEKSISQKSQFEGIAATASIHVLTPESVLTDTPYHQSDIKVTTAHQCEQRDEQDSPSHQCGQRERSNQITTAHQCELRERSPKPEDTRPEKGPIEICGEKYAKAFSKTLNGSKLNVCPAIINLLHHGPITCRARRHSPNEIREINAQIEHLANNDIIKVSNSPYSSNCTLVPKKNGKQRLIIN